MVFGPGSKDHKKTIKVPMEIHMTFAVFAFAAFATFACFFVSFGGKPAIFALN